MMRDRWTERGEAGSAEGAGNGERLVRATGEVSGKRRDLNLMPV